MKPGFRLELASLLANLVVIFCASFASAQGIVTGSITGTVEDPQGAVIPGAKITARELSTNRPFAGETTSAGNFTLRGLPAPATYEVKIEAPNYRAFVSKEVGVVVGTDTSLGTVRMEVGAAVEN